MDESASHRLKLHRARQHIQTLNAQVGTSGDRDPYSFSDEYDAQSGHHAIRIKVNREPPAMWGAVAGDALQDMRAALDHLAYSLALAHSGQPPRPQDIEFPIFDTQPGFREGRRKRIGRIHPRAQALIQRMQPYRRWNAPEGHTLWVLHDLARLDRHRELHILPAVVQETDIDVRYQHNIQVRDVEIRLGGFVDGAIVATFRVEATGPNAKIDFNYSPLFGIAFDQEGPGRGADVVEALSLIRRCIAEVVFPPLERFL